MCAGDLLVGVVSSGAHSNGFSLIRRILAERQLPLGAPAPFATGMTMAQALLAPTRLYVKGALTAVQSASIKGFAHITGGGITENLPRVLPDHLRAEVDLGAWEAPSVFGWLAGAGGISDQEMLRTFNCGVGLIAVVPEGSAQGCVDAFASAGDVAQIVGVLRPADGQLRVCYKGRGLFA